MSVKTSERDSSRSAIVIILLVAIALRLIYLILYSGLPVWDQLTVDNYYHHNWAQSIAQGNIAGDTTYFRAPFYIFCLGALYAVFGTSLWVGRLFGIVVGVLSVFMTYRIGRRVFSYHVGLVAAVIQAIYPAHLYFEAELLLDPLFTLLLQLSIYYVLVWWDTHGLKHIFIAGLLLGLAAITRPTALIALPVVAGAVILVLRKWRPVIVSVVALMLGVVLIVAPVTVRNLVVASDPVLISSQGGINLYLGNNDAADGVSARMPEPLGFNWRIRQITYVAESDLGRSLKPGEVSSYWTDRSLEWMSDNPLRFLSLYARKLYYSFSDREISNNRSLPLFFDRMPLLNYNPLSFGVIFALGLVGAWMCRRNNRKGVFLFVLVAVYVLVGALFFFSSRFRLPLLPCYIVLSAFTLHWISTRILRSFRAVAGRLISVVVLGLFSFYPVVGLPPGDPSQPLISEGIYYLATERFDAALNTFMAARQIDPAFPETNLNIGATYMRLGNLDSAYYYFNEEKRLNPGRSKADINIASVYLLRGQPQQAAQQVSQAIQTCPYDVMANRVLLRALYADSLVTDSQLYDSATAAARRTADDLYLLNEAAVMLTVRQDFAAAESLLTRAVASNPPPIETDDEAFERHHRNSTAGWAKEKARSYYQWGYIKGLEGLFEQSTQLTERSIALDSSRVEAYVNLISGYLSAGREAEAGSVLSLAISKFPDDPHLRQLRLHMEN